jgi:hypothetical protein
MLLHYDARDKPRKTLKIIYKQKITTKTTNKLYG